ncbi:MAG: hypothetical protein ACFE9I_15860 [Candidatus Hermodarchaeota archaeon]
METFDFDRKVQDEFDKSFSDIKKINWYDWLEVSSNKEYEELALRLSELSSIENIMDRIKIETTDSRSFSIDLFDFLEKNQDSNSFVFCHTSGTTNSNIAMLKWFLMTKDIIKRQWAPGMQAIFESSGLNSNSSAVIFVPSRLKLDGIQTYKEQEYISLYSSEFSQRIMLSITKPRSYLFYEYKNSKNLEILSKILSMEKISVISAPATTILGWADINRLQSGIKKSMNSINSNHNPVLESLLSEINKKGIEYVSKGIQKRLSEKLAKSTLVFSISSLSNSDWELIRKFMKWEKGKERFTNLYVASEIGPFAASINKADFEISRLNQMYIFPLTIPVIEYKGKKELISRTTSKIGKLYVSRIHGSKALINIDIGDIISIKKNEGLPQIDGKILRSNFLLRYPIKLSKEILISPNYNVYAGDYFNFNNYEIYEPRFLLNCIKQKCELEIDSLLLLRNNQVKDKQFTLFLYSNDKKNCSNLKNYYRILLNCIKNDNFKEAIINNQINIRLINENPVNFLETRSDVLEKVRSGKNPKGILKKWPLYLIDT